MQVSRSHTTRKLLLSLIMHRAAAAAPVLAAAAFAVKVKGRGGGFGDLLVIHSPLLGKP